MSKRNKGKYDFKEDQTKSKEGRSGTYDRNSKGKGSKGGRPQRGKQYNDVSWYMKDKTIVEAFAKLPFNFVIGGSLAGADNNSVSVPSIVSYNVDWVTSPTCSCDVSQNTDYKTKNLLDLVATIVYTKMRRANSGSTNNIEHVDVIISNLLASIDICCNVHFIHRLFNTANSFSWKNRSIPNDIFSDHWNIDFNDFVANQANYRGRFDTLVALAQTIRTLSSFNFVEAAKAQFSEIFKDSDSDTGREQIIVSAKPFHHIYDAVGDDATPGGRVRLMETRDVSGWSTTFPSGTQIIYTGTPADSSAVTKPYTVDDWLNILQAQIYALVNDSDFNLIQADIEKAFGDQSGYIVLDPVRDVTPIKPVYSGEFLTSFHNGLFYPIPTSSYHVGASNKFKAFRKGTVVNTQYQKHENGLAVEAAQDFGFWVPNAPMLPIGPINNLIDLDSNDPSVEDIVIATRFKSKLAYDVRTHLPGEWTTRYPLDQNVGDNAYLLFAEAASNFILWGGNITVYVSSGSGAVKRIHYGWSNTNYSNYPLPLLAVEYHPLGGNGTSDLMGELNNIRYINASELLPIQEACFLSLWNVPEHTNI